MALKVHGGQINKDSIWDRDLRFQFKAFLILLSRFLKQIRLPRHLTHLVRSMTAGMSQYRK